jgi:hypothetical protein
MTKEQLYLRAINNLLKRVAFLELYQQGGSEKQMEKEIKRHPKKYVIKLEPLKNKRDIIRIKEILDKLGSEKSFSNRIDKNISCSEVGDMFGLKL